jgi:hypothetical protein
METSMVGTMDRLDAALITLPPLEFECAGVEMAGHFSFDGCLIADYR